MARRAAPPGRIFLPMVTPWEEGERKVAAAEGAYHALPATWDADREDHIFSVLFDGFGHRRHHATELPPVKPTVAEAMADPGSLTFCLTAYDPGNPVYTDEQIIECAEDQPELEALHRWAMVLHNQYPWNRAQTRLSALREIGDDDFVVTFIPRDREVASSCTGWRSGSSQMVCGRGHPRAGTQPGARSQTGGAGRQPGAAPEPARAPPTGPPLRTRPGAQGLPADAAHRGGGGRPGGAELLQRGYCP